MALFVLVEPLPRSLLSRPQYYELEATTQEEVANQTFEFPSSKLACILSPKRPKPGADVAGKLLRIGEYDCKVDKKTSGDALDDVVMQLFPPPALVQAK